MLISYLDFKRRLKLFIWKHTHAHTRTHTRTHAHTHTHTHKRRCKHTYGRTHTVRRGTPTLGFFGQAKHKLLKKQCYFSGVFAVLRVEHTVNMWTHTHTAKYMWLFK